MKSRLLVAGIGLPLLYLVLLSAWNDHLLLALVVSAACGIATLELCSMTRALAPFVPAALAPIVLAPIFAWKLGEPGLVLAMLTVVPLVMTFQSLSVPRAEPLAAVAATLIPIAWILPAAALLVLLRQAPAGFGLVTLLVASVFLNDTGAYFTGRLAGRHKLAPRISPNKSIEGFLGGVALGTFTMWYGHFLLTEDGRSVLTGWEAAGIGLAVALATPLGDLFESLVKRAGGVKDSGRLLGEHGGLLDRMDALLVAVPVMYVGAFFAGAL